MWNCFHQNFLLNIYTEIWWQGKSTWTLCLFAMAVKVYQQGRNIYIALSALASSLYNLNTHIFLPIIEPIKHKLFFRDFYTLMSADANIKGSKPEILRLMWDIVVFRLVAYLLNMIYLILQLSYKIASIWILVKIWHSFISISRGRNIR